HGLGYVLAGTGPFVFGLLRDLTGDWTIPLWVVVAVLVLQLVTGTIAGRPGTLGRAPDRPAS
ncbi:MAG TPA: hypothetical protein VK020_15565, partial [Microlunatus sp.]|nr:hypothetical protein [Microlunatus sp.]